MDDLSLRQPTRAQWVRRLAGMRRSRTAIVLSGGGPLGALQVGALKALFAHGVRPDIVVGSSVGALNATFLAFDPSPSGVDLLERVWRSMSHIDLVPGTRLKTQWARFVVRGDRVFENVVISNLVSTRFGDASIEQARIPLGIVVTDLETGAERLLTAGRVLDALLASTALPGLFPPVRIDDRLYIDGGVVDNVPMAPALEMGATTIYAIDATAGSNRQTRPLTRPIDYLLHAVGLARAQRVRVERPSIAARARLVMVPVPALDFYVPFSSMRHTDRLIDMAHDHVSRFLTSGAQESGQAVS